MKTRFLLPVLAVLFLLPTVSRATDIRRIDTEVWLVKNGNAVVWQRWDVNVTQGTEWYIPIGNLGQRGIRDLDVFEDDVKFENDGRNWDSNRSLAEKTHRCGIVEKEDGVELCWGQGEYGDHVYSIIYVIEHLVQRTADGENHAFNWRFLNDEWIDSPDSVRLVIRNEVDSTAVWQAGDGGNMGVWAFGCEADVRVENGEVIIESTEPLQYYDNLTVLMRFDQGLFAPTTSDSRTFAQLQEDAFAGSDYMDAYEDDIDLDKVARFILYLCLFLFVIPIGLTILYLLLNKYFRRVTGIRYKKDCFGRKRITGWFRDIPLGGRLDAAYALLDYGDRLETQSSLFPRLIGAYFLRWVQQGLAVPEKDPAHEDRWSLRMAGQRQPDTADPLEKEVYHAACEAAGKNGILEEFEFRKWSESNYWKVLKWPLDAYSNGRKIWQGMPHETRCELPRFRNYLQDFTISSQREVPEVALWEDYLVFAQLFGIADKVSKGLQRLYPDQYAAYLAQSHLSSSGYSFLRSLNTVSSSFYDAAKSKQSAVRAAASSSSYSSSTSHRRYSGGGGHSSHRGGGGHSGGGHGGGSR